MATLDEQIAQGLSASLASGELQSSPNWGKPLALDDGYDETPPGLRMPFKVMKLAGYVPHEVVQLHEIASLREELQRCTDPDAAATLRRRIVDLQQLVALRLERLRRTGSL